MEIKQYILSDHSKILDQMGSTYLVMDFNVFWTCYNGFWEVLISLHEIASLQIEMDVYGTFGLVIEDYLLGTGESYGPTAQLRQDYPIFFIQLNYVYK